MISKKNIIITDYNGHYLRIIEEHKAEFDPNKEPDDFVEAYLQQLHKQKDSNSYFSEDQLLLTISTFCVCYFTLTFELILHHDFA